MGRIAKDVIERRAISVVRKGVVEDTETIEEDVRREEVEIDDDTERRGI